MESENLSSLIWLSVSDVQKTDSSKDCIIYRYIIKSAYSYQIYDIKAVVGIYRPIN